MGKFNNLSAFVSVVEQGSFAAAARHKGLSRSQVNKCVIALEDSLGVQLLVRTTRSVSPTPSGEAFYEQAKRILTDLDDAERAIREDDPNPRGILRLNAPMSFGALHLSAALADFMCLYPELKVELMLSDHFTDPVADGFDATLRIAELNENPSLVDHPITRIERYFMAAPDFLKKQGPIHSPPQLAALPCLHYGTLRSGHNWTFVKDSDRQTVQVNGLLCANNGDALLAAAKQGLGAVFLPTFIAGPALESGELVRILPDYRPPDIYLMLLYPPGRHLSPKIRRLLQFLYDRFGTKWPWGQPVYT